LDPQATATDKEKGKKAHKAAQPAKEHSGTTPFIHYAPLHVKGIHTTIPADGNARKAKRMEEVRAKRVEKKEKKRLENMGKKERKREMVKEKANSRG